MSKRSERKFRRRIRARMAKTGERYTTARMNLGKAGVDGPAVPPTTPERQTSGPQFAIQRILAELRDRQTASAREMGRETRLWSVENEAAKQMAAVTASEINQLPLIFRRVDFIPEETVRYRRALTSAAEEAAKQLKALISIPEETAKHWRALTSISEDTVKHLRGFEQLFEQQAKQMAAVTASEINQLPLIFRRVDFIPEETVRHMRALTSTAEEAAKQLKALISIPEETAKQWRAFTSIPEDTVKHLRGFEQLFEQQLRKLTSLEVSPARLNLL